MSFGDSLGQTSETVLTTVGPSWHAVSMTTNQQDDLRYEAFDNPHAFCDHAYGICEVDDDDFGYEDEEFEDEVFEDSLSDAEADAMTLAGAGWGTDEDYGYFGDEF